jgi:purine-binding chemotaxis protein CheW
MNKAPVRETPRVNHYCTFRLAGHLFGFDIRAVKEVNTHTTFTNIPRAPAGVRGYVNLRGNIYLILDLRHLLGMEPAPVTPDSRLLIFKASVGESFGVLVDQIGDIATLSAEDIESRRPDDASRVEETTGARRAGELVASLGKLDGELLVIVDAHQLLPMVAQSMELDRGPGRV